MKFLSLPTLSEDFIFALTFFLIASYQILKNDVILINHRSFFQEKDSPQFHRFHFLKRNSLMDETIKKIFQNEIFINKFLNLVIVDSFSKIGNGQVVENLFLEKVICNLLESHHSLKFGKKR